MMLTLTLAAGLLAAAEPPTEPQKGWVVEVRGYTYHRRASDGWILDLQLPQAKPQLEPIEAHYHDDLSAFFKQLKMEPQIDALEVFYVDDLSAFIKQLKKRPLPAPRSR
jgi:hypothetical protein